MKRKILSLMLIIAMLGGLMFVLSGCGSDEEENEKKNSKETVESSEEEQEAAKVDFDFSEYEDHGEFGKDGIAWVETSDYSGVKRGYIRTNGEFVIPLTDKIRTCRDYEDGIVAVTYNPVNPNNNKMYTESNYGELKIFDTEGKELGSIPQHGQVGYGGDWSTKVFNNGSMLIENQYYVRYFYVRSTGKLLALGKDENGKNNNIEIKECGDYSDGYLYAVNGSSNTAGGGRIWFVDENAQTVLVVGPEQNENYKNVYEATDFKDGKSTVLFQGKNSKYYTVTIDKQGNWKDEPVEMEERKSIRSENRQYW